MHSKVERQRAETGRVRVLVLKARQLGISTYIGARIYHGCTLWPRRRGLVVADKLDRSGEIFGIYERFDEHAGIRPPKQTSRKARELSWKIDSRLTVETARDVDTGRGSTLDFVHASEFASWDNPATTLDGLLDTMPADGGEFWIEATAKGIGNEFHAMWLAAMAKESDWLAIFLPWFIDPGYRLGLDEARRTEILATTDPWERAALEVGIEYEGRLWKLTPEQLAWRRLKIREKSDPRKFRQENPATADEAFLVSGDGFFDADALAAYSKRAKAPIARGTFIAAGGGFGLQRGERGYVRIWEQPDPNGHYVLGADTAEGKASGERPDSENERGGRDFCSADVIKVSELVMHQGKQVRVPCLRQVAQIHGRMAPEVFADQVMAASLHWSCVGTPRRTCLTGIERNHSSGQTALKRLAEIHRHPELFVHRRVNVRTNEITERLGWVTDGDTRMPMLDEFARTIREGRVEINSGDTIRECATFTRREDNGRPEAAEDCHDDRVISFAIAVQMREYHRNEPVGDFPAPEPDRSPTGE